MRESHTSEIYQKLTRLQAARDAAAAPGRVGPVSAGSAKGSPAASATSTPAPTTAAAAPSMAPFVTQMVERALAVARFRQELDERIASAGIAGVEDVLELSDRLRSGLDRVLPDEIDQAQAQLDRVRDGFTHLGDELQHLKTVKLELTSER